MHVTRRHLRVSLGALWLLDGCLQLQPSMFRAFSRNVLLPAGQGESSSLVSLLHAVVALVSAHPALCNTGVALTQLLLGLGLITRRFTRLALTGSIAWALMIWVVGEGLGGLTTGSTLLSGAPGAALLYAVIAVIAWPARQLQDQDRPSRLTLPAWSALWLTGAVLQFVGGNNSPTSLTSTLRSAQSSSPRWISSLDRQLIRLGPPTWASAAEIALFLLVAIWVLVPGWTRYLSIGIGSFIAVVGWLVFQGLGDLTSGHATDPNTGPLVILLAFAVVGATRARESPPISPATLPAGSPRASQRVLVTASS